MLSLKLLLHQINRIADVSIYRVDAYGLHASDWYSFNHEGPRRGFIKFCHAKEISKCKIMRMRCPTTISGYIHLMKIIYTQKIIKCVRGQESL